MRGPFVDAKEGMEHWMKQADNLQGIINAERAKAERLRTALEKAARALEVTADFVEEQQGLRGTAQGIGSDAAQARAALQPDKPPVGETYRVHGQGGFTNVETVKEPVQEAEQQPESYGDVVEQALGFCLTPLQVARQAVVDAVGRASERGQIEDIFELQDAWDELAKLEGRARFKDVDDD